MTNAKLKEEETKTAATKPKRKLGGLYLALFVAGFILLGQSSEAFLMWKLQTRLALAFLSTPLIIVMSKDRAILGLALVILWGGFLVTMLN